SLIQHLVLERDELVLLDFEAGLEPLGRATAQGVDVLLIVTEPDGASIVTARRIYKLAQQIGVRRIFAAANKIREPGELRAITENLEIEVIGALPYSERLRLAIPISLDSDAEIRHGVQAIFARLRLDRSPCRRRRHDVQSRRSLARPWRAKIKPTRSVPGGA
ncbi:MAG: hypothetical protein ACK4HB_07615, partial [Candidatus Bipolaricaulia bacterium]